MITIQKHTVSKIEFSLPLQKTLIGHCIRKHHECYVEDESLEPKGYGIIGGVFDNHILRIKKVVPLKKNARLTSPYKEYMDDMMKRHAKPSVTPLDRRGWVTDPQEMRQALVTFEKEEIELVGSYHMHRVPWEHDPIRDTATMLDTILAQDTDMLMFIVSVVNEHSPTLRAFYEGSNDTEIPICLIQG